MVTASARERAAPPPAAATAPASRPRGKTPRPGTDTRAAPFSSPPAASEVPIDRARPARDPHRHLLPVDDLIDDCALTGLGVPEREDLGITDRAHRPVQELGDEGLERAPRVVAPADASLAAAAGPHVERVELKELTEGRRPLGFLLGLAGERLQLAPKFALRIPGFVLRRSESRLAQPAVGHACRPDPLAVVLDLSDGHQRPRSVRSRHATPPPARVPAEAPPRLAGGELGERTHNGAFCAELCTTVDSPRYFCARTCRDPAITWSSPFLRKWLLSICF